jgi:hypothetical protein
MRKWESGKMEKWESGKVQGMPVTSRRSPVTSRCS